MTKAEVKRILNLRKEAIDHYDKVIKEQNFRNGYSQLAIDLFDKKVDIQELIMDYIMEKLENEKD